MSELDPKQIRRLLWWNRFWLVVVAVVVLCWLGVRLLDWGMAPAHELTTSWGPDGLSLTSSSDGPFVVTHLARYGMSEADKATAALSQPIGIIDSCGGHISQSDLDGLAWYGIDGREVDPPKPGDPITALYYRPLRAKWHPPQTAHP